MAAAATPTLLVLLPLSPEFERLLSSHFRLIRPSDSAATAAGEEDEPPRAALVWNIDTVVDAGLLDRMPSVRCVVTTSTGVNHIDLKECARRGVAVANAAGAFTVDVADYAVGMLLDVLQRVSAGDRFVRAGVGSLGLLPSKVSGTKVGIVGLGSIGAAIAVRLAAFGCDISYFSRNPKPSVAYTFFSSVLALAGHCDALIVSCALTAETRHIINRDVLRALGERGVIVNIGRGALVDEPELVRALRDGAIAGAGLDVFENEPHVPDELRGMENVVLSPHRAVFTPESISDMQQLAVANLRAFFAGEPLVTPVVLRDDVAEVN